MHRSTTRLLHADAIRAPSFDDAVAPGNAELPDSLVRELAAIEPREIAASLVAVCDSLRWLLRTASAVRVAAAGDPASDDSPVARAVAATVDWARDILLDAGLLAGKSAAERAAREEMVRYADLHVHAFVGPAISEAQAYVRERLGDPRAYEALDALVDLQVNVARAGAWLRSASPVAIAA